MKQKGFTLIGVMIVVAIIGILAGIAYPSYVDQVRKARRTDARNALLQVAAEQERYYSENNTYGTLSQLGYGSATPLTPDGGWYQLSATAIGGGAFPANSYLITAAPQNGQGNDPCGTLTLDSTGAQTESGGTTTVNDCW